MSKNIKVNNKSYKTNNDIVKLDFQDEKSDNEDTEFNERNKKRTYSIDNKESVMVTPKKNALDMIKSKIQTSPNKTYQKKSGVIITKIKQDDTLVGVAIEGGYLARSYLLGLTNSEYMTMLAPNTKTNLQLLSLKGKFWTKTKVTSTLTTTMDIDNVDYLVSKTTKEPGNGAVLLFTAYQLLEIDTEADFNIEVYKKIQTFFNQTKMPPDDKCSVSGYIQTRDQAEYCWNEWTPWSVTEECFELNTEQKVDAFLEIAEKNKL
jgi:hypothetical protein